MLEKHGLGYFLGGMEWGLVLNGCLLRLREVKSLTQGL